MLDWVRPLKSTLNFVDVECLTEWRMKWADKLFCWDTVHKAHSRIHNVQFYWLDSENQEYMWIYIW